MKRSSILYALLLSLLVICCGRLQAQTLQVTLSPDKSKVDRSTKNGIATIFFDSSIEDLSIVCTTEDPNEPIIKINDNLWYTHIDVKKDLEEEGVCYRNYLLKCSSSSEYYLTTDTIAPNQVLYYTVTLPNELEPKLQEAKARSLAAQAEKLANEGNFYMAQLVALQALPPNYPLTPEAEAALRNVYQNVIILRGHDYTITSVAFSPDGKNIISSAHDRTVRFWDVKSGKEIESKRINCWVNGKSCSAYSASFSPDGRNIIFAADSTIQIWEARRRRLRHIYKFDCPVYSASVSPNGRHILSVSDSTIHILDIKSGKLLRTLKQQTKWRRLSAAFSPDGQRIISLTPDSIKIWDVQSGKTLRSQHPYSTSPDAEGAVFSHDGKCYAVPMYDGVLIWDSEDEKIMNPFNEEFLWLEGTEHIASIDFSPDDQRILVSSRDGIQIWDLETGKLLQSLRGHLSETFSASFSPDGQQIVFASYDNTIRIWDTRAGGTTRQTVELGNNRLSVNHAAYSPDGSRIVSASDDKTICIRDAISGVCLKTLEGHKDGVETAVFCPDGSQIVSASKDKTIRVWDVQTGKPIGYPLEGHTKAVYSAALSLDGKRIVSASEDHTIRIWDARTEKCIQVLDGHTSSVHSAEFSSDGRKIVSASLDGTIRIWDALTGLQLGEPLLDHKFNVRSASFSPDGGSIVSVLDGTICIWDVLTRKSLLCIEKNAFSATFSPDGLRIISGNVDGTVSVWDVRTGKLIQTLKGHTNSVTAAAFCPDGHHIVSSSRDGSIRIWDFPPLQDLIDEVGERYKDCPITDEERRKYNIDESY